MLVTFEPTRNGKWFAILETHIEVRQFEDAAFFLSGGRRSRCGASLQLFRTNAQCDREETGKKARVDVYKKGAL